VKIDKIYKTNNPRCDIPFSEICRFE